ncbi:hypothetical protein HPB48_026059 [Haemaphysalis longicornis]|uniref:Endonuclease/exonuclease/phosphatase domain-containing protein n=1 Tax=Haemaphysalis longicornis TaxID=44386 RepID=A0A9J6H9U3_HAELO|nr:hypothetical protein HPB48_026059 [Haemaphysalis longicornis]
MEGTTRTTVATTSLEKDLLVWHWNCNGFTNKRAVWLQHLQQITRRLDVIMIQETHSEERPKIPGYRLNDSPPSKRETSKGKGRGVCTFIRKGITFIEHELLGRSAIEHCAVEIITGKKKESTYLVNAISNPALRPAEIQGTTPQGKQTSRALDALVVCSDLHRPNREWGIP